jgi:hypothetical protein
MSGNGYSVYEPGLDYVRQGLEDTHASLVTSVEQASPVITIVSDAYPGWQTSAVNTDLLTHHAATVHGHAADIAGYATGVGVAGTTYSNTETAVRGNVAAILNPGTV